MTINNDFNDFQVIDVKRIIYCFINEYFFAFSIHLNLSRAGFRFYIYSVNISSIEYSDDQ